MCRSVLIGLLLFGIGCLVDSSTSIEIEVSGLATGSVVYVEYTPPETQDTIRITLESENGRDSLQIEAEYDTVELRIESEVDGNTVRAESPSGFPFLFRQQTVLTILPRPSDILIHAAVANDTFMLSYPYPSPIALESVQRVLVRDLFSAGGPPFHFVGVGKVLHDFGPGKVVIVNATAPSGEFSIALHCGTPTEGNHQNIALQLRSDMQSDMVQLCLRLSGIWIGARSVNGTPFTAQQPFSIMLAAQVDHFDIIVNGIYFASYDYPVAGRSNMTIYAHQVQTLSSISYSEVPLSSGMVTDIPLTQVPCQLDCMQSTSLVILQPSTLMTDTGNAVSTGHLGIIIGAAVGTSLLASCLVASIALVTSLCQRHGSTHRVKRKPANTDQMVKNLNMKHASVSVESPEEQCNRISNVYITAHGNIGYQNEHFGQHTSVLYNTISKGQTDQFSQTSEPSLVHGYNYPQLTGYSEVNECLVEPSTGTQLETLDSSDAPSNHYQGLQPETRDYMTLYHTANGKGNRVESNGKDPSTLLSPDLDLGISDGDRGYAKPESPRDQYETLEQPRLTQSQNCPSTAGDQYETLEEPSHTQNQNCKSPKDQYETSEKPIHTRNQNCRPVARDQYETLEKPRYNQNQNHKSSGDQYETLEKPVHTQSHKSLSIAGDQYETLEQPRHTQSQNNQEPRPCESLVTLTLNRDVNNIESVVLNNNHQYVNPETQGAVQRQIQKCPPQSYEDIVASGRWDCGEPDIPHPSMSLESPASQ